jgi:hypothetical protein
MLAAIPYAELVGAQDPVAVLASTPDRLEALTRAWDRWRWSSTYAEGKWSAAQLVLHLAHDEIGWGSRARLALTIDGYVVQPYDGASWVALESPVAPETALTTFVVLRRLNVMLYRRLSSDQRGHRFGHPLTGEISIDWIIHRLAGHDLHHLEHLHAIAKL